MPLERHHARAHEAVLHFGDDATLLLQQVLRVAVELGEQAFDAGHVADGFGERARQLLDVRIAVELERIEIGAVHLLVRLVLVEDLRLGLHLELAQLFAQAGDGAVEFDEVELDRGHLLVDAGAEDADFARVVEQVVEQVRIDTGQFATFGRRHRFASRQDRGLSVAAISNVADACEGVGTTKRSGGSAGKSTGGSTSSSDHRFCPLASPTSTATMTAAAGGSAGGGCRLRRRGEDRREVFLGGRRGEFIGALDRRFLGSFAGLDRRLFAAASRARSPRSPARSP